MLLKLFICTLAGIVQKLNSQGPDLNYGRNILSIYIKRLPLRWIHHIKSDWINNKNNTHISGIEPYLVILCKKGLKKVKMRGPRIAKKKKKAEAKGDVVINPQNYNFSKFETRKILMFWKRYELTKVDRNTCTWLNMPSETYGPSEVTFTICLKYKKRFFSDGFTVL